MTVPVDEGLIDEVLDQYQLQHCEDHTKASKENAQKSAIKHVSIFMQKHADNKLLADLNLNRDMTAHELTYEHICNDKFVGCYLDWLASEGRYLNSDERLSMNTLLHYTSMFKSHFCQKFRDKSHYDPPTFTGQRWKKKLTSVASIKLKYLMENNLAVMTEKETATDFDNEWCEH